MFSYDLLNILIQQGDIDEIIASVDLNSDNPKNVGWIEMKGMKAIEKIEILVKFLALQGLNDIELFLVQ